MTTATSGLLVLCLRSSTDLGIGLNAAASVAVRAAKVKRTVPGIDSCMTLSTSATHMDRPASLLRHMRAEKGFSVSWERYLSPEGSELTYS